MTKTVQIWHYGLVARWWSEFNVGGPDVDYFCQAIADSGEPGLDAGCGTGRLLLPFLRQGLDVDGTDASAEMLDWCRRATEAEGFTPTLQAQAMHELDLERRYRTVVVCGAFGLGGNREDDLEGLRRIRRHLEPGGTLVLDHYLTEPRAKTPKPSTGAKKEAGDGSKAGDRRPSHDGSELELRIRPLHFDPDQRTLTREVCALQYIEGREVTREVYEIDINLYSREEIESALQLAGFRDLRVTGELLSRPARAEDNRIVFHAGA